MQDPDTARLDPRMSPRHEGKKVKRCNISVATGLVSLIILVPSAFPPSRTEPLLCFSCPMSGLQLLHTQSCQGLASSMCEIHHKCHIN